MTSKLKCPVCPYCNKSLHCGAELNVDGHNVEMWCCTNYECEPSEDLIGTREMWEIVASMTQAKQDLEIATKALDKADRFFGGTIGLYQSEMMAIIKTALEQIAHDNSEKANSQ